MTKLINLLFLFTLLFASGCSTDDENNNPNYPSTGEVLLATVSGDSVGTAGTGFSSRSFSITSGTLNFTDRSYCRISFFYSGQNNSLASPIQIYYSINDSTDFVIYSGSSLNPSTTEQFIDTTFASPNINTFFKYRIETSSSSGSSYFKFRDLKIYKK